MNRTQSATPLPRNRERGVVLFIALIAMAVLSLAGVALVRSMDTNTSVAGNLAFRQASMTPVNWAVEKAVDDMFYVKIVNAALPVDQRLWFDDTAHNYYASLRLGERPSGIPAALWGASPSYPVGVQTLGPDAAGNTVHYMVERVCQNGYQGDPLTPGAGIKNCDLWTPKQSPGRTTTFYSNLNVTPIPLYRLTARVDGPANTVTFGQAMLAP